MNNSVSISTVIIIGLVIYLLLRSQNAQAAEQTAESADNGNASLQSTGNADLDAMLGIQTQVDKMEEAARNSGFKIGEFGGNLPVKNNITSVREGWQGAIEIWKKYANSKGDAKKKNKHYVGLVILACNNAGGRNFEQAYDHLCRSHGDIAAITTGYEWGNIWNKLSSTEQNYLSAMNSFAKSAEYVRWYQEMD